MNQGWAGHGLFNGRKIASKQPVLVGCSANLKWSNMHLLKKNFFADFDSQVRHEFSPLLWTLCFVTCSSLISAHQQTAKGTTLVHLCLLVRGDNTRFWQRPRTYPEWTCSDHDPVPMNLKLNVKEHPPNSLWFRKAARPKYCRSLQRYSWRKIWHTEFGGLM